MSVHKKSTVAMVIAAAAWSLTAVAAEIEVDQLNKTFEMGGKKVETLTIHVGDKIDIKNRDPWFHNVVDINP